MDPSDDRLKALTASVADQVRATLERELASLVSDLRASSADDRERGRSRARREAKDATSVARRRRAGRGAQRRATIG